MTSLLVSNINYSLDSIGKDIIQYAKNDFFAYKTNGLLSGNWGVLIFLFYYSRFKDDRSIYNLTSNLASYLLKKIDNRYTYCDGLSGILYALLHLKEEKFIDINIKPYEKELIQYLKSKCLVEIKQKNYDFLHGYIGLGLFLAKYKRDVTDIVNALYDAAEIDLDRHTFKWKNSKGTYDISLSHGISSIILFLVKIFNYGCYDQKCYEMIIGGCNFLLSQKMDYEKIGSFFPSFFISNSKASINQSRLAWCYGDLGVSFALYKSAKLMNNAQMEKLALDILEKTTLRKKSINTQVMDASLCHGTAGLAMFYRRLYLDTQNTLFLDASDYWIMKTLTFSKFDNGIGGYKAKYMDEYKKDISLLMGAAGIGMEFISSIQNDAQKWDDFLLLS